MVRQHGGADAVILNRAHRTTNLNDLFSALRLESPKSVHI